jgi:hypothetical protein
MIMAISVLAVHLTRTPRTRLEATTRRMLGIHSGNASSHDHGRS